eukprot:1183219-Prorocentrum_minimum.AAC.5
MELSEAQKAVPGYCFSRVNWKGVPARARPAAGAGGVAAEPVAGGGVQQTDHRRPLHRLQAERPRGRLPHRRLVQGGRGPRLPDGRRVGKSR